MKFKTTAKEIRQEACRPVSAGYCDLQYLFYFLNPIAYACGVYGWNFDVYMLDGLTVTTGYRGMVGNRAVNIEKYNNQAEKIVCDNSISYQEQKEKVSALLKSFIDENITAYDKAVMKKYEREHQGARI